jgi:hypothetical protein
MRNKNRNKERRAERQAEALLRQAAHDKLTTAQKLDKLFYRPGFCEREANRLAALLNET